MADNRVIDEQTIGDIILCDPITRAGREALARLGLTIKDVSPSYFYENLRVKSKYDERKVYEDIASKDRGLYYQYTVDFEQFELLKKRFKEFDTRFYSNSPNEYPLLMLGVAGNGKTIEVNRRIREIAPGEAEFECCKAYFDLEEAFTKVTYDDYYQCPSNRPLWLFCIKLLDGIMQYIKQCHVLCSTIAENFNNTIMKKNLASNKQKLVFQNIRNYCEGDSEKETAVFCSLKELLMSKKAEEDIQSLLEILLFIMYCSAPDKNNIL